MKKHLERYLLQPLMLEVVGGFNISWLLRRPSGDKAIFDLHQSAGLLPGRKKKKHPLSAAGVYHCLLQHQRGMFNSHEHDVEFRTARSVWLL